MNVFSIFMYVTALHGRIDRPNQNKIWIISFSEVVRIVVLIQG